MATDDRRAVLITGVGRRTGIGFATARLLAESGYDICITHLDRADPALPQWSPAENELALVMKELRASGARVRDFAIDLSDVSALNGLIDFAAAEPGGLYALVNNATVSIDTDIESLSADLIDQHYEVNIRAPMLLTQAFVRRHRAQGPSAPGRVLNLTSGYPLEANPGNLAYAATKEALNRFVRSVAPEIAAFDITINSVDPGPTDTGWMSPELQAALEEAGPMGRVGTPEDAARLIRFLLSDDAGWITGQIINSRGGF